MSLWTKYTIMFNDDTLPNSYEAIAYILLSKYWQSLTLTEHYTDLGNYCEIFFDLLKLYDLLDPFQEKVLSRLSCLLITMTKGRLCSALAYHR